MKIITSIIILIFTYSTLFSQLSMIVYKTNGSTESIPISEIDSIFYDTIPINNITDTRITFDYSDSYASSWFGGDDRTAFGPRNIPYGQSVKFNFDLHIDSFACNFITKFDYFDNPTGTGHEVDIKLQIRDTLGTEINSKIITIPNSFNGGWYEFDISDLNVLLNSDSTYIFTLYLIDGFSNNLMSSVRFDGDAQYSNGERKNFTTPTSATNSEIEDWSNWESMNNSDNHFRISGRIIND